MGGKKFFHLVIKEKVTVLKKKKDKIINSKGDFFFLGLLPVRCVSLLLFLVVLKLIY